MMCGDIDESWVQLAKLFNIGKKLIRASPLQWGQHLERELMLVTVLGY
jgi:hypothetical protein